MNLSISCTPREQRRAFAEGESPTFELCWKGPDDPLAPSYRDGTPSTSALSEPAPASVAGRNLHELRYPEFMGLWDMLANDKRRFARVVPLPSAPVEVQIMGAEFLEVLRARDISVGGVCVIVRHAFEGYNLAEAVELVITLPKQRAFLAQAVVRRIDKQRTNFAVEFTQLEDKDRRAIEAYVTALLAQNRNLPRQ